jgi:hypothetical protein
MANVGNGPESREPDNKQAPVAGDVQPSVRTRRARVYGSFKRLVSRLWTDTDSNSHARPSDEPPRSSGIAAKLIDATAGLLFISETDAPVDVFVWSGGAAFSREALRVHEHIDAAEPVETEDIDHFFRNVTKPREWHEAAEKEQVRRFGVLRDLLKAELTDVTVYRFGTTAASVYVLGRAADGTVTGIRTKVVET